jgi:hypothetical protein
MTSVVDERTIRCTSNSPIVGKQGREVHFNTSEELATRRRRAG